MRNSEPAVCLTKDGVFWEYDGRRFSSPTWSPARGASPRETWTSSPGPWRHVPACVCEACRLGNV